MSTSYRKPKVVLLTEIISPYRIPVFNEIAKDEQIDFKVLFLAEHEPERPWRVEKEKIKFDYQILRGIRIPLPNRFPLFYNPRVYSLLRIEDPDFVICGGYHHPAYLSALCYARKYGKCFLLWCESHQESVRIKSFPFHWYRDFFIRSSNGFVVPGRKSFDFIQSFGIDGKKIWIAPNAVDNDFFSEGAKTFHLQKEMMRSKRGFPPKLILYVGRLIDDKGISVLLDAFQSTIKFVDAGLVLVGDGKDKQKYINYCQANGLRNIFFEGYKQQHELPFYYGVADLFVLPTRHDEWGLVLNEAAASGLPLIATDVSGAALDLIEHGKNGYVVSAGDQKELTERILEVLLRPELQNSMGRYSQEKVEAFSPVNCARGFIQAILNRD